MWTKIGMGLFGRYMHQMLFAAHGRIWPAHAPDAICGTWAHLAEKKSRCYLRHMGAFARKKTADAICGTWAHLAEKKQQMLFAAHGRICPKKNWEATHFGKMCYSRPEM